ncbi:hypothetical protein B0A48_00347 [Cryoendolithus antarcticus]|uniref:Uncharacterized protein n=1 Tax=Cryoendolithus antarcticus TaxID=1507870 RepID=A0A1V8TU91_9PEZI|nr:hypothetical protein B0A48_00347 [Cryoendolithus antarcticus]
MVPTKLVRDYFRISEEKFWNLFEIQEDREHTMTQLAYWMRMIPASKRKIKTTMETTKLKTIVEEV